jgi:predicted secreted Zn-dependent protease
MGSAVGHVRLPLTSHPSADIARQGGGNRGRIRNVSGGTNYYDVSGATLADVYNQLDPNEWGRCDVNYSVTYHERNGNITRADVTVTDTYRMPRWRGRTWQRASRAAKAEWRRMLSCLWTHEHGHRDIGRREATTIRNGLIGTPSADFQTTLATLIAAAQTLQDAYDARTQHGQTQGVSLNTSIP